MLPKHTVNCVFQRISKFRNLLILKLLAVFADWLSDSLLHAMTSKRISQTPFPGILRHLCARLGLVSCRRAGSSKIAQRALKMRNRTCRVKNMGPPFGEPMSDFYAYQSYPFIGFRCLVRLFICRRWRRLEIF